MAQNKTRPLHLDAHIFKMLEQFARPFDIFNIGSHHRLKVLDKNQNYSRVLKVYTHSFTESQLHQPHFTSLQSTCWTAQVAFTLCALSTQCESYLSS